MKRNNEFRMSRRRTPSQQGLRENSPHAITQFSPYHNLSSGYSELNSTVNLRLPQPEHKNLAESFSSPALAPEIEYDSTVFKILPSLKKKHMPGSFLSLKHSEEFTKKLSRQSRKIVIKDPEILRKKSIKKGKITTKDLNPNFRKNDEQSLEKYQEKEQEELKNTRKFIQKEKLPLHFYDPIIDPLTPKSMIETRKKNPDDKVRAYSKWFDIDGTCNWKKCYVESYDAKLEKYKIIWDAGGEKYATRINLRFEDEDPERFEIRISEAKKYRDSIENNYCYNIFVSNYVKSHIHLPVRVLQNIFIYVRSENPQSLDNYKDLLISSHRYIDNIHNPSMFLWKTELTHFIDENYIFKSKGFENQQDFMENFIKTIPAFQLFTYPKRDRIIVGKEKILALIHDFNDHWKMVCKHIDYKMQKFKIQSIINNPCGVGDKRIRRSFTVNNSLKGSENMMRILDEMNEKCIYNDVARIKIMQKLNDIIISWKDLRMLPKKLSSEGLLNRKKGYGIVREYKRNRTMSMDELMTIYNDSMTEFLKEAQNALFDIQYEIQDILTKEDQKRLERNASKLKARAYSKQSVDLEHSLPTELLEIFRKFTFVCNLRIETSLRNIIFASLENFYQRIFIPIEKISGKLKDNEDLTKKDFLSSNEQSYGLLNVNLTIDHQSKKIKAVGFGENFCSEILSLIQNSIKKLENVKCLSTTQTGSARSSGYLCISEISPGKLEKLLSKIEKILKWQNYLLQKYVGTIEKFSFVLDIKPEKWVKKYDDDMNIDRMENEIFRLKRIKVDIIEDLGENSRVVGIWKVHSSNVRDVMIDIIDKTIEQLTRLLQDDCSNKVKEIQEIYEEIKKIISHIPKNLEELEEIKTFLSNDFTGKLDFIEHEVTMIMGNIEILEGYWTFIPFEMYKKSWTCMGYSKNLKNLKDKCLKTLDVLIVSFTQQLNDQKMRLVKDINETAIKLLALKKQDNYQKYEQYACEFGMMQENIQKFTEIVKIVNMRESIINQIQTDFKLLTDIKTDFTPYCKLWFYIRDFLDRYPIWMNGPIGNLHRDAIANELTACVNELSRYERGLFKNEPAPLRLIKDYISEVNNFRPYLPIIRCVNNPGMKERHWLEFYAQSVIDLSHCHGNSLLSIVALGVLDFIEQLETVSDLATKELGLENAKRKMENEWAHIKFDLLPYKTCYILVNTEVVWDVLNEHLMRTNAMSSSPYIQFLINEITTWKQNLMKIQDILEGWENFQHNWQYLQPIFTNNDISKQLSQASNKFRNINSQWENIMNSAYQNSNVYEFCINNLKLLDTLTYGNECLDSILKSLNEYLMSKRKAFPRFYFLSNEELILMLSNSQEILTIQKYIVKCFEAIASVRVDTKNIVSMISPESEEVMFENPVAFYDKGEIKSLEVWMVDLEKEMRGSLEIQLFIALQELSSFFLAENYNIQDKPQGCIWGIKEHSQDSELKVWVNRWPSQLVHASLMAVWTSNVEQAVIDNKLKDLIANEEEFLSILVEAVRKDLKPLERLTFSTMVVIDVHNKDIVENLINSRVTDLNDFAWFCSMRFYMQEGKMRIKMLDCIREYGYEYLGNTGRLVITELTDRCYRTLMSALNMSLGGAPEGPAGTGKTETTKDLAKILAKKCVVFNCSDRLDHIYMAKFFTGLCYCGAWACFDEFNRIELDVLSVIAEQILSIQTAVQKQATVFKMDEEEIQLDHTCAIFITMNPDYAGRTKLPDNLKALFRPVAMMIPDYAMIAEIYLYSFGFRHARILSQKITNSLKLASEQLSTQHHYDYGMRAVSTIIKAAGWLKQQFPKDDEENLVLKAIKNTNIPKFINQDIPLFNGIVKDLFPNVIDKDEKDEELMEALANAMIESMLIRSQRFISKTIEIYTTILLRHGLMIVGESMSGKSTALNILNKALSYKNPVSCCYINPKSITLSQLYGAPDPISMDWKDGVLAQAIREYSESTSKGYKWIVMDGPVDAVWIESMNTVMDDNKKLCLPSGEIIKLTDSTRIIVEVDDLSYASPATISRCGMIYMDADDILGPGALIDQWVMYPPLKFTTPRYKDLFKKLFKDIFFPVLEYWNTDLRTKRLMPITPSHAARNVITLFQALIIKKGKSRKQHDQETIEENSNHPPPKPEIPDDQSVSGSKSKEILATIVSKSAIDQEVEKILHPNESTVENNRITHLFIQAVQWSLAGTCDEEGRKLCSGFLYNICNENYKIPVNFSEMYYNDTEMQWVSFKDLLTTPIRDPEITNTLVPTISLVSYQHLLNELIPRKVNTLISGLTGTGKTLLMKSFLADVDKVFQKAMIMFSARTSAGDVQTFIESNLMKRRKGCIGPDTRKFFIFMIDDLNMPMKEVYGAQPAIELLRIVVERAELYDRSTLELKVLEDVQYISILGKSGGYMVSQRFLASFFLLAFDNYGKESLFKILSTLLDIGFTNYPQCILDSSSKVAYGIITVYEKILKDLPPTPTKSHYTFSLRDLSNVLKGIFIVPVHKLTDINTLCKLWVHECLRVFSDRLIDLNDKEVLLDIVKSSLMDNFSINWSSLIPTEPIFCNFIDDKAYQEVANIENLKKFLTDECEEYSTNNTAEKMNLIFFDYAIKHICRISRVIFWNSGNMLLIGVGGSGRMSLTKLTAFILKLDVFQIKLTKTYATSEWSEDLKTILIATGQESKKLVFFLRDSDIIQESFLESINNILNTGYFPNLFSPDEISGINESLKMNKKYAQLTDQQRWEIFLSNVKRNLHIVMCMFPHGEVMRSRIRQFPALINCCTIDWFTEWPSDALNAVAEHFLHNKSIADTLEKRKSVIACCVYFHETVRELSEKYFEEYKRYNYVTPTNYLHLLKNLKKLYKIKEDTTIKQTNKYSIGIQQLDLTQNYVQKLRSELLALKPILQQKTISAEETLWQIQKENQEADITRSIVASEQKASEEQTEIAEQIKKDCMTALANALPELEAAIKALDTIRRDDIDLVKTMRSPPDAVKLTLEALAIINNQKPVRMKDPDNPNATIYDYFEAGKKMLSIPKFIKKLKTFDRESIEEETIFKLNPYIDLKKFHPDIVKYASSAAEGLCKWVRAMYKFYHVNKEVKPKKASLIIAEDDLKEKVKVLKIKQEELRKVEEYIAQLQNKLNLQIAETRALSEEINKVEIQMDRAVKLIDQLGGEREAWTLKVKQYSKDMENLLGDVLMSAGVVSYMGPFIWSYREYCLNQKWIPFVNSTGNITCSNTFSLPSCVGEPVTIQKWTLYGLPSDKVSIENAIIIEHSSNYPLIIDPQGQASKWLKKMLGQSTKQVFRVKMESSDFIQILENCLLLGADLMIEDLKETIDPVLDPLLLKQFYIHEAEKVIKIGDVPRPYDDNFYLYLFTRLTNPHFSPEVSTKATILNFCITEEGLGEQLLDLVCRKEIPKDTEERNKLTVQTVEYIKTMQALEDKILELLKSGGSTILESEELIISLTKSKNLSTELEKKLANAKNAEQRIINFQGNYKPAAKLSAIIYFCITDLANIGTMYQYSMSWFINIFKKALSHAERSKDIAERVKNITLKFREMVYLGIYNSLQDSDRLLFVFLMAIRLMLYEKEIHPWQWRYFLTGICGITEPIPNPTDFLSDKLWRDVVQLDIHIEGLRENVEKNQKIWKNFVSSERHWVQLPTFEEFSQELPEPYAYTTMMTRLLIYRAIKPEALGVSIKCYVKSVLGENYLKPNIFSMAKIVAEASVLKPILFVLTGGHDPQGIIKRYTTESEIELKTASLGKGQGERAEKIIKEAILAGNWVLLQNCHLSLSWLPTLESILEQLTLDYKDNTKVNEHFRLILTTVPTEGFPSSIIQKSVKVIAQPPGGLCNSLLGIYANIENSKEETQFYESSEKPEVWKKLFFSLTFFHCVIRERGRFGPVGWNITYEFNDSDLGISSKQLMQMVNNFPSPPFEALIHLTASCNYGGRVTDDWDRRTLKEILLGFYHTEILAEEDINLAPVPGYVVPRGNGLQDIALAIKEFPQVQSPEVFGLHPNAEISKSIREAYNLCSRLLALQPRALSISFDEQKSAIFSLSDTIVSKVVKPFDLALISIKYPVTYYDSMSTVLTQELARYNGLIEVIKSSLITLRKAYEGIVLITPEYEILGESLLKNEVPELWKQASYSSCKSLVSWTDDLKKRIEFFNDWIEFGRPKVFWISGFFFTQSFLTAVLQEYARNNKLPIDTIKFSFEVLDKEPEVLPESGALIKGLYLEGACWDGISLSECKPRELYFEFPLVTNIQIWLKPSNNLSIDNCQYYTCPVYRTLSRAGVLSTTGHSTNFILAIFLKTVVDPSHWVKRGVALFTQLDD